MKPSLATIQRRAFEGFFQATALAADFSPRQKKMQAACSVTRNVPYADDQSPAHLLDVIRPAKAQKPLPVLLYIHGGGFTICSKETHRGLATAYAHYGNMVVANINYRMAPKHRFPAAIEDAAAAYAWIVKNAERFGGDPTRIVVGGESAGGNLTLAVAAAACFDRPEPYARLIRDTGIPPTAILVLCGLLQVSDPGRFRKDGAGPVRAWHEKTVRDVARAYLGRGWREPDPAGALADPLLMLESGEKTVAPFPEVFAMVGTKDILLSDTRRLEAALKTRGVPNDTRYYPGEGHAFQAAFWRKQAMAFWRDNFAFLHRVLKTERPGGRA